jgi:hypothetical protein
MGRELLFLRSRRMRGVRVRIAGDITPKLFPLSLASRLPTSFSSANLHRIGSSTTCQGNDRACLTGIWLAIILRPD